MTAAEEVRVELGDDQARIALAGEALDVSLARRVTASIFVEAQTTERVERVEVDLQHEHYDIERVAIGLHVTEAPATRQEGDVTIIPVMEEVVVVERRLVLKEEIRIRRVLNVQRHVEDVVLRRQHAEVRRVPTQPVQMVAEPGQTIGEN